MGGGLWRAGAGLVVGGEGLSWAGLVCGRGEGMSSAGRLVVADGKAWCGRGMAGVGGAGPVVRAARTR